MTGGRTGDEAVPVTPQENRRGSLRGFSSAALALALRAGPDTGQQTETNGHTPGSLWWRRRSPPVAA